MEPASPEFVARAINDLDMPVSCTHFHAGLSCNAKAAAQFMSSLRSCSKMYFLAHLIPFLLFKRKKVRQNPWKEVAKLLVGFCKSMLFAGGYTAIIRRMVCLITQNYGFTGYSNLFAGMIGGVALNFQPIVRQSEIALYSLNKSMEVSYLLAKRRGWPVKLPHGECLVMIVASAIICYHYMNNRESFRDSYLRVMDRVLADS